ncbi:MAG: methyltransferase domain-containing protein [Bacteroidia bacterium]|nr:methyltransferase domain-containing protein [Bacteroidia bacterium]
MLNRKCISLLKKSEFPRSASYDAEWMLGNQMGPNAVWLVEWLTQAMKLQPGMRVLDLGCGRAMTSIFLAREFGVHVWAVDLWMSQDNNWQRVQEAGLSDLVYPMKLEAHALPFPSRFFDAIISIDAYQYFGTDVLYLAQLTRLLREGGYIGVVVPALMQDFDDVPEHLTHPQSNGKVFWEAECRSFKTAAWWQRHWQHSCAVTEICTDILPDGWQHWRDFEQALELSGRSFFPSDAETLERDAGRYIGFVRATAKCTGVMADDIYDAALGFRVGAER